MESTIDSLLLGFSVAFRPDVLLYAFLGCVVGTLVGMLPGIGPLAGISILLPVTFGLDATKAIIMLAGIYYGSQYGGSTTSILMRIPGEASSVMTCIDGYAMAQKGRAGAALCIAAVGSFIAGTFGVVALTVIAPPLGAFALRFGPPEYTALLIVGLIFLAYMSSTSLARTLLMAAFGLMLGCIGIDVMTGHFRYAFDIPDLGDGIGIVPVAVGLFGLGEILSTPSHSITAKVIAPRLRELLPTRKEWRELAMPIARGSVLGFIVGIVPGSAHIISSFMSYALEKRISKHPEEFGQGAVAGVAGPELANNSASTGAFVPMLALGLPTGPVTAVLMAALLIHGVPPGPQLVTEHPDVFWGFIASMYVGNLMLLALNLPLVGMFVNVLRIPYAYLYPLIIMFCIIGVYEVNHSIIDVWIMLVMGVVGYLLRKFDFDPAPLVLGLVIAPTFEMSLRQSLIMSNGAWTIFFERPISAGLLAVSAGLLILSAVSFVHEAQGLAGQARRGRGQRERPREARHENSPPAISAACGIGRRAGGAMPRAAWAQSYPARPITLDGLCAARRRTRYRRAADWAAAVAAARPAGRDREPAGRRRQSRPAGGRPRAGRRLHAAADRDAACRQRDALRKAQRQRAARHRAGREHRQRSVLHGGQSRRCRSIPLPSSSPTPRPIPARSTWRRAAAAT